MITKSARLALIRARAALICSASLPGLLSISRREIAEETNLETATARNAMQDDIQDEETAGVIAPLSRVFDRTKDDAEGDAESILSRAERNQLRKEIARNRAKVSATANRNGTGSPFSPALWLAIVPASN